MFCQETGQFIFLFFSLVYPNKLLDKKTLIALRVIPTYKKTRSISLLVNGINKSYFHLPAENLCWFYRKKNIFLHVSIINFDRSVIFALKVSLISFKTQMCSTVVCWFIVIEASH